jgi:hypothetical protein
LSAVAASWTGCPAPLTVTLRDVGVTASEKSGDGGDVPVNVAVDDPAAVP